jgi:LPS O-antigen subunit length determinant protein (WzzB/FepE family)
MHDIEHAEATPLMGPKPVATPDRKASRYALLAIALIAALGISAVFMPSFQRSISITHLSVDEDAAAEMRIFKLADTNADDKVSVEEVFSSLIQSTSLTAHSFYLSKRYISSMLSLRQHLPVFLL